MKDQAHHHGDGIETQLLSHRRGVVHLQDFTGDQENYPEGKVPAGSQRRDGTHVGTGALASSGAME